MIILASDHGGYELKEKIKNYLAKNYDVVDVGAFVYDDKDDYPKYAKLAMQRINPQVFEDGEDAFDIEE